MTSDDQSQPPNATPGPTPAEGSVGGPENTAERPADGAEHAAPAADSGPADSEPPRPVDIGKPERPADPPQPPRPPGQRYPELPPPVVHRESPPATGGPAQSPPGGHPIPPGAGHAAHPPTGSHPVHPPTGAHPVYPPTGSYPAPPPTGSHSHRAWNPATGMAGWDPRVGPPGWAPQAGYTPPRVPPNDGRWGLSPFGMPARHSWEIPLLVIVVLATAFAYIFALLMFVFGEWNQYVLILVFAPAILWIGRGMNYATMRVNGVKMSPTQFPEGYRLVQEAAERLGMAKAPDAFVVLGNGQINAFASGHGFRRYVAVYSDLFEVGGAARHPDALAFIIGHEVGHIAAGHVSYWRQFGMFLVPFLPFLGNSLIRSQEYTADNYGYCFRHEGASGAMRTLAAGKYLNSITGFDEMADRAAQEKGFWVWIVNALSSHPVLTWRMWALRDRSRHGKLFLRPDPPIAPPGGARPGPYGGGFPDTPRPLGSGFTEPPRPLGGGFTEPPQPAGGFTEPPRPYGEYPPYPRPGYGEQPPNYGPGRGN